MADQTWLKNLARAKFSEGAWLNEDQQEVDRIAQEGINDAVTNLFEECVDAADIFNLHSSEQHSIRILPISKDRGHGQGGLILLLAKIQINVELIGNSLVCSVNTVDGFERKSRMLSRLAPHVDAFGSVMWFADKSMLLSTEQLTKRLFEQLVRSAFESK
jgi:hypothetical protein